MVYIEWLKCLYSYSLLHIYTHMSMFVHENYTSKMILDF